VGDGRERGKGERIKFSLFPRDLERENAWKYFVSETLVTTAI